LLIHSVPGLAMVYHYLVNGLSLTEISDSDKENPRGMEYQNKKRLKNFRSFYCAGKMSERLNYIKLKPSIR